MIRRTSRTGVRWAMAVAGATLLQAHPAAADPDVAPPATRPATGAVAPARAHRASPHRALPLSTKAREHYRAAWGVDALRVSRAASGNLLRFNYRVTDPAQAAPLVDKDATPVLYAPRSHATLSVPVMDKVGPLRQAGALQAGRDYWVAFSNKGNLVKPGDRVDVIIGRFHADGLLVE